VRAVVDGRVGTARTNRPELEAIKETVKAAVAAARVSPRVADWPGLPQNPSTEDDAAAPATAECTPGKRAELVHEALTVAKNAKLETAGALETESAVVYVGNNRSPINRSALTEAKLSLVLMALDSSGYGSWIGSDLADLNVPELALTAAQKADAGRMPADLPAGGYTVILEPPAVADMLGFLAYVGLGAQSVQEKRSFMTDRLGEQLVDPKISLWDDGNDPRALGPSFDYEGVPKQKVVFFDRGVARTVVYDSRTAAREDKTSTGHALPAPNQHGPLPTNLFLAAGDSSLGKMIAGTERGVLVTRFHYTNIEEPMRAVLTGMTRDGTFMIENGRVTGALRNLRFTQSILDALSAVVEVGDEARLVDSFLGACHCPALKIDNFNFTGISEG
jgi:PmbA protein